MKKKILITLMALCLGGAYAVTAYANTENNISVQEIAPRYDNISLITRSFEVHPDGSADFVVHVYPKVKSDVEITVNIQEYINKKWKTIDTFESSKDNTVIHSLSDETSVTPKSTARAEFIITVTTDGVEETETLYSYDN